MTFKNIPYLISEAIRQEKWLNITYLNANKEQTYFSIGVADVDTAKKSLLVDIFNFPKFGIECLDKKVWLKLDNIIDARLVDNSYYPTSDDLFARLSKDIALNTMLDTSFAYNNVLTYFYDCYKNDADPFVEDASMFDGIDLKILEAGTYQLSDEEFIYFLEKVFIKSKNEAEKLYRYSTLAFNILSIDINDKQYVIAYREVDLNFKNKTLRIADKSNINKSFLINERKYNLSMYLDMDPDEFVRDFDARKEEFTRLIEANKKEGEMINTRPSFFLLKKQLTFGVEETLGAIYERVQKGQLNTPLKAFFGVSRNSPYLKKEANIVIFDKNKVNIDQLRVIFNAMNAKITYVQGPPGTGKTETIFNTLLSALLNDKKVLVCANNNHPVDDIYHKLIDCFKDEKNEEIITPFLRLGNNDEIEATLKLLKNYFALARSLKDSDISIRKEKRNLLSYFHDLKASLSLYEEKIEIEDKIKILKKIKDIALAEPLIRRAEDEIKSLETSLMSLQVVEPEALTASLISIKENEQLFTYFKDLYYFNIKKLNKPMYEELEAILDDVDAVTKFNRYLRNEKNLEHLLDVFPIVLSTNLSSEKLGSAYSSSFDLCIMDEAGQANIASALIPLARSKALLLVGDTNQLQPVSVIELDLNDYLMEKYSIKKEYNYVENSILSSLLSLDANSKRIMLHYHYRCAKKIANFVNQRFYEEKLKILNNNEGSLVYVDVKNRPMRQSNAYLDEASSIVDLIKNNHYEDVAIITPFVHQARLINSLLKDVGISEDVARAGTIHTLQGSEKNTIIMSSAISLKTAKKTMDWIAENAELINVAVSRAKQHFIFVGDKSAIDIKTKDKQNSDVRALSDYVYENGKMKLTSSPHLKITNLSNDSKSEEEFFMTIKPFFMRKRTKFYIERNVPLLKALPLEDDSIQKFFRYMEFDLVVKVKNSLFAKPFPIVIFEIDGGEHIGDINRIKRDRDKEAICARNGVKLIRISNDQVKDYELIIKLFMQVVSNIKDFEDDEQITLFED